MEDLRNKAYDLVDQCKYKEAIECFNEALVAGGDNKEFKTSVIVELGYVYCILEQFDLAMDYFREARDFAIQKGKDGQLFDAMMGIGNVKYGQKKFKEALSIYDIAARIHTSQDNMAYLHRRQALAYIKVGSFDFAKTKLDKAVSNKQPAIYLARCFRAYGDYEYQAGGNIYNAWINYCDAFLRMVKFRKGSYHDAETCGVLYDMACLMLQKKHKDDAMFLLRQVYIVYVRTFGARGHSQVEEVIKLFGDTVLPTEKNPVPLADVLAIIETVDMRETSCCSCNIQ